MSELTPGSDDQPGRSWTSTAPNITEDIARSPELRRKMAHALDPDPLHPPLTWTFTGEAEYDDGIAFIPHFLAENAHYSRGLRDGMGRGHRHGLIRGIVIGLIVALAVTLITATVVRATSRTAAHGVIGTADGDGGLSPIPSLVPSSGTPLGPTSMPDVAFLGHSGVPPALQGPWPTLPVVRLPRVPRLRTVTGIASTYGAGWDGWIAWPQGPGWRLRVCGPSACRTVISNDAGPDKAMQRKGRVIDLDVATFEAVSGGSWRVLGLVRVTVTVLGRA